MKVRLTKDGSYPVLVDLTNRPGWEDFSEYEFEVDEELFGQWRTATRQYYYLMDEIVKQIGGWDKL